MSTRNTADALEGRNKESSDVELDTGGTELKKVALVGGLYMAWQRKMRTKKQKTLKQSDSPVENSYFFTK